MLLRTSSPGSRKKNAEDLQTCGRIQTDSWWLLGKLHVLKNDQGFFLCISTCILASLISVLVRNEHICQCVMIALVCGLQTLFHTGKFACERILYLYFFPAREIKQRDVINQNGPFLGDKTRKSIGCCCTHLHDVEIKISQATSFFRVESLLSVPSYQGDRMR